MYSNPQDPKMEQPTKGRPIPLTLRCVVDTGTQITAIGRVHAEKMGIDCSKLAKSDTRISCLSGDEIYPLGSFFGTLRGRKKKEGKMKEITTKEIIYVFEKTPTPYISRAVLITMGVVKQKMEVGDFIEAGGTQATFKICTEVRNEKGERACKCPERYEASHLRSLRSKCIQLLQATTTTKNEWATTSGATRR